MINILVSGASGIIGYGILKSLKSSGIPYNLIGISIYEDSVAPGFCNIFLKAPLTFDNGYIKWLVKVVKDYNVDILIPSFEDDVSVWNDNIEEIQKSGAKVMLNNTDLIDLCQDKWQFYEKLISNKHPNVIPSSLSCNYDELIKDFGLPLFIKPRRGSASKGVIKIYNKEEFEIIKEKIGKDLMVQPLIGNDEQEYSTSAFCDGKGGYFAIMSLKRKLSKEGYTEKAEVYKSKEIEEVVASLCTILTPIGPTNFQFRKHDGIFYLLEINPRISSSTSIRSSFGYNESAMAVDYFFNGLTPKQPEIKKGNAIRYIEDFIFYT
jgi:carbamoyl-phosphate synthase large subunit